MYVFGSGRRGRRGFVLHVCLLRECDVARLTTMLVWGMDEVW